MATLAEIRAKLLEKEQRTGGGYQSDNAIYAFWNIPENSTATLRFLPDSDETNTFFWKERQMIRLSFPGIKGQDESRSVTVQVPCVEMWGDACPVHAEIRPWFKDPSLEDEGRKYWKKRSYIFQGFVTDNPMSDDQPPENPMTADRVKWEHIHRVFELCNRNVSETARRLKMHRRTLQRILSKRSPN